MVCQECATQAGLTAWPRLRPPLPPPLSPFLSPLPRALQVVALVGSDDRPPLPLSLGMRLHEWLRRLHHGHFLGQGLQPHRERRSRPRLAHRPGQAGQSRVDGRLIRRPRRWSIARPASGTQAHVALTRGGVGDELEAGRLDTHAGRASPAARRTSRASPAASRTLPRSLPSCLAPSLARSLPHSSAC
jgi:hypothetical protein